MAAVADVADAGNSDESGHFLGVLQELLVNHSICGFGVDFPALWEGLLDHL